MLKFKRQLSWMLCSNKMKKSIKKLLKILSERKIAKTENEKSTITRRFKSKINET